MATAPGRAGALGLRRVVTFLIDHLVVALWMGLLFLASGPLGLGGPMGRDLAPPGPWHWAAWITALLLSTTWFATAMIGSTPYDGLSGTVVRRRREGGGR